MCRWLPAYTASGTRRQSTHDANSHVAGVAVQLFGRLQSVKIVEIFNDQIMSNLNFSNTRNVLSK